jgi:hypothetical protein
MMKQPAENSNVTMAEMQAAAVRATPRATNTTQIEEEVAKVAYELWQERHGEGGSAEEDWLRAEAIVVKRLAAKSTA